MNVHFSPTTRDFIDKSRLVALDLGYEYITTIHFFLADCQIEQSSSLRFFAFSTDQAYQDFYSSCRKQGPGTSTGPKLPRTRETDPTLPLTQEAEKSIRRALVERNLHGSAQLEPCHIFLGAAYHKDSLLRTVLRGKGEDLYPSLEKYYKAKGLLTASPKRKWWQQIFKLQ